MTETGAVSSQFDHRGIISIEADDPEELAMAAIEAGAADVATDEDEGVMTVYTEPTQLKQVQSRLGAYPVTMAELGYVPRRTIMIEDQETAWKVINLMNALEELDDVTNTYSNFDIPQGVV
jgi:transcriptional/translational regulatory protein YebC/TACO1